MKIDKQTLIDWMISLNEALNTDAASVIDIIQDVAWEIKTLLEEDEL